ncbi:unnamed protein product [Protopolystoma xenopodis]|uniref:J domain-containing protein n=1 Tax=Protopolystoma xenopodis TaxID=117903 RepID=A0A3S5A7H4_9PLAT|nr:unnamed protein product [Protopolystoma xenopodis]
MYREREREKEKEIERKTLRSAFGGGLGTPCPHLFVGSGCESRRGQAPEPRLPKRSVHEESIGPSLKAPLSQGRASSSAAGAGEAVQSDIGLRHFMGRNFYDILNVSRNASKEEIRKAYRQMALKYHPDKNKSPQATNMFREIAVAYEVSFCLGLPRFHASLSGRLLRNLEPGVGGRLQSGYDKLLEDKEK